VRERERGDVRGYEGAGTKGDELERRDDKGEGGREGWGEEREVGCRAGKKGGKYGDGGRGEGRGGEEGKGENKSEVGGLRGRKGGVVGDRKYGGGKKGRGKKVA